jgi:hypothetical protein
LFVVCPTAQQPVSIAATIIAARKNPRFSRISKWRIVSLMPRPAPSYIPVETIAAYPIEHAWDDWDPYELIGEPDPTVAGRLQPVSLHAVLAFALACTEWILYRLKNHSESDSGWLYVDAQWAGLLNSDLAYEWEPGRDHMDGPVRGPIDMAVRQITNCGRSLYQQEGELDAALIAKIAVYVLPDPAAFLQWQDQALERLAKLYDRDGKGFGPPVPREAMDPGVQMTAKSGIDLAEQYVRTLDFSNNEFLDPAALPEAGKWSQYWRDSDIAGRT